MIGPCPVLYVCHMSLLSILPQAELSLYDLFRNTTFMKKRDGDRPKDQIYILRPIFLALKHKYTVQGRKQQRSYPSPLNLDQHHYHGNPLFPDQIPKIGKGLRNRSLSRNISHMI